MVTAPLQRISVHGVLPSGELLGEGWVRHGESPQAAIARVTHGAASGPADGVTSRVVDLPDLALQVHVISVGYPVSEARPDRTDRPRVVASLFDEPPPTDHIDHLVRDAGGARGNGDVEVAVKVQRPGAYALVTDGADGVLLTRLSRSEKWTLPGGGIDFGEHPDDAVRREVYEETGLALADQRLLDVGSAHWTGRAPDGRLEDFHSVQVLYRGSVAPGSEPVVVEVNGSTDLAAWVRVGDLERLQLTGAARFGLSHLPV